MRALFQHILVATDLSAASERAIAAAVAFARAFGARVTLVHVIEDMIPSYAVEAPVISARALLDEVEATAQRKLDARVSELRSLVHTCDGVLLKGRAADEIVRYADGERAELVVVGTHGRRGPSRWLLGSVAEKVVRSCHAAVLTVRAA